MYIVLIVLVAIIVVVFAYLVFKLRVLHVHWTDLLPYIRDDRGLRECFREAYKTQLSLLKVRVRRLVLERCAEDVLRSSFREKTERIIDAAEFPEYHFGEGVLVFYLITEVDGCGFLSEGVGIDDVPDDLLNDFYRLRWASVLERWFDD